MKLIRFNLKQVLSGAFAFTILATASPAFAQIGANTDDIQAHGSQGLGRTIMNTGTDAITIKDTKDIDQFGLEGNFQVMVWDGEQPMLSWTGSTGIGSLPLDNCYRDPDVVIHKIQNRKDEENPEGYSLYAMVVYEDHDGQIQYETYRWDNSSTFDRIVGPLPVGNNQPMDASGAKRLKGQNPNIDVNSEGKVALTWHESFSYPATSTVTYGTFSQTYTFDVVRSEIYAVFGHIDGSDLQRNIANGLRGTTNGINGDKLSTTANLLYEHNMYPDVAISERDKAGNLAVTITYSKMYFMPFSYTTNKNWVVDQRILNTTGSGALSAHYFNGNAYAGSETYRPRVASRKLAGAYAYDFETVTGPVHRGCNEDGYYTYSPIYNFGRYNNIIHAVPVVNAGYTDTENYEPVVSYRYGTLGTTNGEYIVAWSMNTNYGPAHQRNLNVLATTMFNGVRQGAQLAWVNKGNVYADNVDPNEPLMGHQQIPSLAGIYCDSKNQYLFVDMEADSPFNDDVKYKDDSNNPGSPGSSGKPGTSALRQSQNGSKGFSAYPNPFTGDVNFNLQVESSDVVQSLTITDLTGRQLDKLNVQDLNPGTHTINWQSRTPLPAGIYLAKLQTRDKVTTIRIVKQ